MRAEPHDGDRAPRGSLTRIALPAATESHARDRQAIAARLVDRCASGDQQALAELHSLFSQYMLRVTSRIVRNAEVAEDVVQEVFLYAWRNAGRYDPRRSTVSTWLWQISRSRAIDYLRRRSTRERAHTRFETQAETSHEPPVEREILGGELRLHLDKALGKLPAAQREALTLAYYSDMTQTEIADQTDTPLGTVKTRTFLAMRKLRSELPADLLQAG